jgi:hypothetical protein
MRAKTELRSRRRFPLPVRPFPLPLSFLSYQRPSSSRVVHLVLQERKSDVRSEGEGRCEPREDAGGYLRYRGDGLRSERVVAQCVFSSVLPCKGAILTDMLSRLLSHLYRVFTAFPSSTSTVVVNLAPSIAVTQNYVSERELPAVLAFMRNRPEQVSGFKLHSTGVDGAEGGLDECDETGQGVVLEKFVEALRKSGREEMVEKALAVVERRSAKPMERKPVEGEKKQESGMWSKVKETQEEGAGGGFTFGFGLGGDDFELDDDLLL